MNDTIMKIEKIMKKDPFSGKIFRTHLLTPAVSVFLLLGLVFSIASPFASALDAPRLKSSDAYLVVDMDTGTELISLNPDQTHSIASLTKIMTCLLGVEAVESGAVSLTDMVTAQDDCLQGLDTSSSNAGIKPGETMSFEDLLYCALVHSANDACNVIATHVAGSIPAFVKMMNARAAELGCENTQFIDTDGMLNRSDGHYSSPRDLYKIASEAMNHQLFARICGTADYTVSATNLREAFEVHNSNALLSTGGIYGDSYVYSGVSGIKTGFTKPAGYCLVSVCERLSKRLMCIVLGCNGPLTYTFAGEYQNFEDSITLYDWAFTNFESRTVFLAGEPLKRLPVTYAKDGGTVALCAAESVKLFLSKEITDQDITTEIHPYEDRLVAPITEGDELGYVDVYIGGELRSTVRLLADASVEMARGELIKAKIAAFFTSAGFKIGIIVLVAAVLLFFVFRNYRKLIRRRLLRARIAEKNQAKWTEQSAVYAAKEDQRRRRNAAQRSPAETRQSPASGGTGRRIPIETLDADRDSAGVPPRSAAQGMSAPVRHTQQIPAQRIQQAPAQHTRQASAPYTRKQQPTAPDTDQMSTRPVQTGSAQRTAALHRQDPVQRNSDTERHSQSSDRPHVEQFPVKQNHYSAPAGRIPYEPQQRRKPVIHEGIPTSLSRSSDNAVNTLNEPAQEETYDLEDILNSFK